MARRQHTCPCSCLCFCTDVEQQRPDLGCQTLCPAAEAGDDQ